MPFSHYKQSMRASFLQTRKLFFAAVVIVHAIITLIAAVDVSGYGTRKSNLHLTAAALNLATHLFSFITITLVALLDSIDQNSRWCVSQVRFEVAFVAIITFLQLVNSAVYAAYFPKFECAAVDSTCMTVGRIILVGSWILTVLHMLYAAYFIAVAIFAAQRVKKVWVSPTKGFAWDPSSLPISRPSAPLDILGHGATMIQVERTFQRETWVNPQHNGITASPKLPPVSIPPVPPVPVMPRVEDIYPGQTYPGQKLRRGAITPPSPDEKALPATPRDDYVFGRPLTAMSEASRYSPPTRPLMLKGHSKGAFSQDTGMARYAYVTREPSVRGRGEWMTPGFVYGREYVDRTVSPQPSLPVSPRQGHQGHRRQQPSINSYRNQDGRYPTFF